MRLVLIAVATTAVRSVFAFAFALGLLACGADARIGRARHASYDTDLPRVFDAVIAATAKYPRVTGSEDQRVIKTAWIQIPTGEAGGRQPIVAATRGAGGDLRPARSSPTRFFARFDIGIVGPRPYRIEIRGEASEWGPGAARPTRLQGDAEPGWLGIRRDALMVSIHKKLEAHEVTTTIPAP